VMTDVVDVVNVTPVFPSVVLIRSVTVGAVFVLSFLVVFTVIISGLPEPNVLNGVVAAGVADASPDVTSVVVMRVVASGSVVMASSVVVIFVVSDCCVEAESVTGIVEVSAPVVVFSVFESIVVS